MSETESKEADQPEGSKKKPWNEVLKEKKKLRKKKKEDRLLMALDEQKKRAVQEEEIAERIKKSKRISTVSMAVPGSILENAQSPELRTYLAGQIARAACIFKIDEVIVFDDAADQGPTDTKMSKLETPDGDKAARQSCVQLARILQYLECPQYLRKFFFPIHKDLKFSGLLNPLDAPHHLRQSSEFQFREGIVTSKQVSEKRGSFVNVGLLNDVSVDKKLVAGLRVTVKMLPVQDLKSRKLKGTIVPPSQPRLETGVYWGYNVRIANTLSQIFSQSPYEGGYDLTIGTSDKGGTVSDIGDNSLDFHHALVVFGGLQGLELALESDEQLKIDDPSLLFDHYLNTVPGQGSRTIRTEEAILISLATLISKMSPREKPYNFDLSVSIPQSEDTGLRQPIEKRNRKLPQSQIKVKNLTEDVDLGRFD